jgi:hypothetical protein
LVAVLRSNPELHPETFISEMMSTYRISEAVRRRIEEYQFKPGELREFVSKFYLSREEREKRIKNGYIYSTYETEQIETELATTLGQTFDKTFLRKGIDMVRYGLETITKAEQDAIIAYCEENKFKKTN